MVLFNFAGLYDKGSSFILASAPLIRLRHPHRSVATVQCPSISVASSNVASSVLPSKLPFSVPIVPFSGPPTGPYLDDINRLDKPSLLVRHSIN